MSSHIISQSSKKKVSPNEKVTPSAEFEKGNMFLDDNFRFNIKSLLLKLLCTLTRLWEGTPLQSLRLHFFGIKGPCSKLPLLFSIFIGRATRWKFCTYPMIVLRSPTLPTPWYREPNHLPLIHRQGNLHAAPRHFAPLRAAGVMSPLCFAKPFLHSLTLLLICCWLDGRGRGGY